MGVFMTLNWVLSYGLSEQFAFLCAYPPSVALHFFLNKRWTFADKRTASAQQMGEYLVMVIVTFIIQWSVFTALRTWSTWPGWLAAGAANVAQMTVSFTMMQVRVFTATHQASVAREPRRGVAYATVLVLVLSWYGYVGVRTNPSLIHGQPAGLYDRLTEGFVAGQTHLMLVPDPRLKALSNPWAGAQGIPRAHDATYFNDRYYVYFGAAPTVVLLVPWRVLTNTFLPDGAATGIFCTVGFLLALSFYRRCERQFFSNLGRGWIVVFGLMLGLGSFVQFELRSRDFYQVPIACAFACGLGVAHALLTAAKARRVTRQTAALAFASLLGGLAVGARPNYFFALSSVAVVGGWLWWHQVRRIGSHSRSAWWLLAAMVGPASVIGLMIAAYNYARFGSALEFGLRYQFAAVDMREIKLFGLERVGLAFEGYVLAGRDYSRYFPFIRQTSENIGLLTWAPFAIVAFAWPLTCRTTATRTRAWVLGVGGLWSIALLNFGSLMLYYYVFDRYVLDFLPFLILVASVMVSVWLARAQGVRKQLGVAALVALLGYTGVHSLVHGLPSPAWPEMRWVTGIFNRLPAWYERITGVSYGAVDVDVEFVSGTKGAQEVLFATARGRCVLTVHYLGERKAEVHFLSGETMGASSAPFDFEPGRHYRLRADLGSLYPPASHALYAGLDDAEVKVLLRRVDVRLDGHVLLRFASSFPDSEPEKIELGHNSAVPGSAAFRGKLRLMARAGLAESKYIITPADRAGSVRFEVRFPAFRAQVGQPLIATGHAGAGDLFYVFYAGPNRLRFGHDAWNFPGFETPDFYYDPEVEHTVEVDMGSLHPEATAAELHTGLKRLRVRLDGREVADVARPFNPSKPEEVFMGHNGLGASTSEVNFSGKRLSYERMSVWPEPPKGGARLLTVTLPSQRMIGRSEPLLVTGKTGAADIIYLKYTDAGHVQIGYDQWGRGGDLSAPIAVQNGRALEIEVSLGSLYDDQLFPLKTVGGETLQRLRSKVQVRVDGSVVLSQASTSFSAQLEQIQVGINSVGASTCAESFSGKIERIEFLGVAVLL